MNVVFLLWLREIKVYFGAPSRIVGALGQPALYVTVLGFGLGPVFRNAGEGSYLQFIAPGIIGMSILFSAFASGSGLIWDRRFGAVRETLVAPVPRLIIIVGRALGAATTACIQGVLVLLACIAVGFRPDRLASIPEALVFMAVTAILFAALGNAVGAAIRDMKGFQLITGLIITPMFFLSGALFPPGNAPPILSLLMQLDPLSYAIDGIRGALVGRAQLGFVPNMVPLVVAATASLMLGSWLFSRLEE